MLRDTTSRGLPVCVRVWPGRGGGGGCEQLEETHNVTPYACTGPGLTLILFFCRYMRESHFTHPSVAPPPAHFEAWQIRPACSLDCSINETFFNPK